MIFRQLFEKESSTYTYLLGDAATRHAVIIDPVIETLERDLKMIDELGLEITTILETHVHADHITGASGIKQKFPNAKTALSHRAKVDCADQNLTDGDEIEFGSYKLKVMETPGHTNTCLSFYFNYGVGMVFTGDTLLIRGCGRTDFQEGSNETLFASVRDRLFMLPDHTLVFPAHNYAGITNSTIGEEKAHNPRLKDGMDLNAFSEIMDNLNLAQPKKIDVAVPANLKCGQQS